MKTTELYELWRSKATEDADLISELSGIKENDDEIFDRFYKELEFGTGGLRGVIGAGTNRMNVYTVGKATQGFSDYINSVYETPTVAIAYDSRIKSDLFAKTAASVFAANGIKVMLYSELMPTPMLSYAVRELDCNAGIVITASHNPSKYNGYKAYGPDGCQLNLEASETVYKLMQKVDTFNDIKKSDFDEAVKSGIIQYISYEVIEKYLETVKQRSVNPSVCADNDFKVIYTPLNGTGNKPVRAILDKIGLKNVKVVPKQELPDGNFPTSPYPNPEIRQAFECALDLAKEYPADILLATDPDCDRVGIAVKGNNGYTLMSGNQVGAMLLDYILKCRTENGTIPTNPVAVKTIVTSSICEKIAQKYNCELINVLTGFKFIGEVIGKLEANHEDNRYVFGFEESYGYLAGTYVRDKDAVVASMLICEMACYYKQKGLSLIDVMNSIYEEHGYYFNEQKSFTCEGASGMERMTAIMDGFRKDIPSDIADIKVVVFKDYLTSVSIDISTSKTSVIDLPKSNVLEFRLENGSSVIIRPSGTEPKIKVYFESVSNNIKNAEELSAKMKTDMSQKMGFNSFE